LATARTVIAASRFGYGARRGDLQTIGSDAEGWLQAQIANGPRPLDAANPTDLPSSREVLAELPSYRADIFAARQSGRAVALQEAQRARGRFLRSHYVRQADARFRRAVATDAPFRERLVHFWTNHFAVSSEKRPVQAIAGTFENEAIRPNVTGPFVDMLLAAEQHPAMILYLDNQASTGPSSRVAQIAVRDGRSVGLNENLAREILELHTLGVDGGYTQRDVTVFAEALTGWSIALGEADTGLAGSFRFRPGTHEPGAKTILGSDYPDTGQGQAREVLERLARHPSTARFLALKLARHFVADNPPGPLVERMAARYLETGGELAMVYEVLIESEETWLEPFTKFKTPTDLVVSTYRALDTYPGDPARVIGTLSTLGQRPFTPGSPAGWGDSSADWDGGDALIKRIEWLAALSRRAPPRDVRELATEIVGPLLSRQTEAGIAAAADSGQALALLLASPEFQRR